MYKGAPRGLQVIILQRYNNLTFEQLVQLYFQPIILKISGRSIKPDKKCYANLFYVLTVFRLFSTFYTARKIMLNIEQFCFFSMESRDTGFSVYVHLNKMVIKSYANAFK